MPESMKSLRRAVPVLPLVLLAGLRAVHVKPEYQMPHALIVPVNARVGLVLDNELRAYQP